MQTDAKRTILVIEDDANFREVVVDYFSGKNFEAIGAGTGRDGIAVCTRRRVDVIILDQKLPDGDGSGFCPAILERSPQAKILFITAYPSFDNAVGAVKAGAYDYISKPMELEELELSVNRAVRTLELESIEQVQAYQQSRHRTGTVLVGRHGGMDEIRHLVQRAADSEAPVLITGETGSGKSVAAKAIHYNGSRGRGAFIGLNCAAIPAELIESELFGHEKGAFTGARESRKGVFEMAEGGTLFLDEIGAMPTNLQAKLLGVLEDRQFKKLGGQAIRPVNARVLAATNADPEKAMAEGTMRRDLYYRLNVVRIHMPALRDRREDIPDLCFFLLSQMPTGRKFEIPKSEMRRLMDYDWPGNIRELRNILERAVTIQEGPTLRPSEFLTLPVGRPPANLQKTDRRNSEAAMTTLAEVEKNYILEVFKAFSGNAARSARVLGVSESTLRRKLKLYGIK